MLLLPLCLPCLPLQPLGPLPPMQLLPMPLRPMQPPPMPPLPMLCHGFCFLMDGALAEQGEASGGRVMGFAHSILGAREWPPMPPLPMLLLPSLPPPMIAMISH